MTPELEPESSGSTVLGKAVSDLQTDIVLSDTDVTGTLKYVTGYTGFSGDPALQEGNYLALKYDNDTTKYSSLKIGLSPSMGSGLVECISDPDHNIVIRVSSNSQKLKMVYVGVDGSKETKIWSLKDLTLTPAE